MKSFLPLSEFRFYESNDAMVDSNLINSLSCWADCHGHRIALQDDRRAISYVSLQREVQSFAYWFAQMGMVKDDRVMVQLPNSVDFFIVVLGLIQAGAVPVLLLPGHRAYEVEGVSEASDATHYILKREHEGFSYTELAEHFDARKGAKGRSIFVDDLRFDEMPQPPKDFKFPTLEFDDVAFLLLSGGTTNIPKLIPRTHGDYLYNFSTMAKECLFDKGTRYLCIIPVAHNFALGCPGVLGVLSVGGFAYLQGCADIIEFADLLSVEQITATAMVPALAQLFIEYLELVDSSFPALGLLQIGAARFSKESAAKLRDLLCVDLQHVYGMAEGLICFNRRNDPDPWKVDTQGSPLSPMDEVRVVSAQGLSLGVGEVGELCVRGPYTIRGYFNNSDANSSSFTQDGFYRSGDLVCRDEYGNVSVVGRAKEQINRAGEKYSPGDTEAILAGWERIAESAVVGVSHLGMGEKAVFFIRPRGDSLTRSDVCNYLRSRGVAHYKYPDEVVMVASLPLTAVGKVDKKKLAADYQ